MSANVYSSRDKNTRLYFGLRHWTNYPTSFKGQCRHSKASALFILKVKDNTIEAMRMKMETIHTDTVFFSSLLPSMVPYKCVN